MGKLDKNSKYSKIKIPKCFYLLGKKINVFTESDKLMNDRKLGLFIRDLDEIHLASKVTRKGGIIKDLSEQQQEHTFYHELVHAILDTMGEEELSDNEKFVDIFSGLLHQSIKTSEY